MSKYLVCINAKGTKLTFGASYLCDECKSFYKVWNNVNGFMGNLAKSRFVIPQEYENSYRKKPESFHDVARSQSRKIEGLLNELERVESERNRIVKDIKQEHQKLGKQLNLL